LWRLSFPTERGPHMPLVRVVVVDDHELVRTGFSTLLDREPDIDIVGTASSGEEGLNVIADLQPDVAVVDYSLPHMSGVAVCEEVVERHPKTAVIILTGFMEEDLVRKAIDAGAKGYVYKDVEGRELKRTIRAVANGEAVYDPKVTARVLGWAQRRSNGHRENSLSLREIEALRLVAQGATNKSIADSMFVSENTVKTYLRRALEKLDCHRRSEAAVLAARRGLL
jgi:two-component system, NarL family, response regulator DevR